MKTSVDDYRDRSIVTFAKNKIEKITASGADIFEITAQQGRRRNFFNEKYPVYRGRPEGRGVYRRAGSTLRRTKFSARPEGKPIAVFDITSGGEKRPA